MANKDKQCHIHISSHLLFYQSKSLLIYKPSDKIKTFNMSLNAVGVGEEESLLAYSQIEYWALTFSSTFVPQQPFGRNLYFLISSFINPLAMLSIKV